MEKYAEPELKMIEFANAEILTHSLELDEGDEIDPFGA